MKKITTLLVAVLLTVSIWAQSPQKMSYQAVIRDASNALVTNTSIGMQISILQTTATGSAVYVETQIPTTNTNGLVSLEIGTGTVVSGDFTTIDWANDTYFIKTETDPTGGTNYTITSTTQLMSVPYALHAKTAESVTGAVAIANGGTGATTKTAAFDALSPMTAQGDIIYGGTNGTGTILPKGTANQVLTMNAGATAPEWKIAPTGATNIDELSDAISTGTNMFIGTNTANYVNNNTQSFNNTALGYSAGNKINGTDNNTIFGAYAGFNNIGADNVYIGYNAGFNGGNIGTNVMIGSEAGFGNIGGGANVMIGFRTGYGNNNGTLTVGYAYNTIVGYQAGYNLGDNNNYNTFIGYRAGWYETGSHRLYIANSPTTTPLIYGEFDNNLLRANGNLEVSGTVKIEGGTPGAGKVLTSDANGLASWQTASTSDGSETKVTAGSNVTVTGMGTTASPYVVNAAPNLTANRALISDSSGKVTVSSTTSTELGYLAGATSNIQNQITNNRVTRTAIIQDTNTDNIITDLFNITDFQITLSPNSNLYMKTTAALSNLGAIVVYGNIYSYTNIPNNWTQVANVIDTNNGNTNNTIDLYVSTVSTSNVQHFYHFVLTVFSNSEYVFCELTQY